MLDHLHTVNWAGLTHAYGSAADLPELLRGLASPRSNQREIALEGLYDAICHQQCTVYEATAPAVPFLIELLASKAVKGRSHIANLLADIVPTRGYLEAHGDLDSERDRAAPQYQQQLAAEREWGKLARAAVWRGWLVYLDLQRSTSEALRRATGRLLILLLRLAAADLPPEIAVQQPVATLVRTWIELLTEESYPAPGEVLQHLANLVRSDPQLLPDEGPIDAQEALEGFEDEGCAAGPPPRLDESLLSEIRRAVWKGWPLYQQLAGDPDRPLRLAAVYLLALLVRDASDVMPVPVAVQEPAAVVARGWAAQLDSEADELARANLVFGLAAVADRQPYIRRTLAERCVSDPSLLVRYAAALVLVDLDEPLPAGGVELLAGVLHEPGTLLQLHELPAWGSYDALVRLRKLGPGCLERSLPTFLQLIRGAGEFRSGTAAVLLDLAFAGKPLPAGATGADLTEMQRQVLLEAVNNGTFWSRTANDELPLARYGLPMERRQLRQFLARPGEPPPAPPSDPDAALALLDKLAAQQLPFETQRKPDLFDETDPRRRTRLIEEQMADFEQISASYGPDKRGCIRSLELCGHANDAIARHLPLFPNLKKLDLCWGEITDEGARHLAKLTALRTLDLSDTGITDAGLAYLAGLTNLRNLSLMVEAITDAGLAHLANLTHLRQLHLTQTSIAGDGLAHLKNLTELRELTVSGPGLTDALLPHLSRFRELRRLVCYGPTFTGRGLAHLAGLDELKDVTLSRSGLTDAGLRELPVLPALKRLDLGQTRVTEASLAAVAAQPGLKRLALRLTAIGDGVVEALGPLEALRELDLSGTKITDAVLKGLQRLPKLRWLDLSDTALTDAAVTHLLKLRKPNWIGLDGTALSPEALNRLREAFPDLALRT